MMMQSKLPEPVAPVEEKKEEKSVVGDIAKSLGLGSLFGGGAKDDKTKTK
jgi:predicted AAA+ superfamily ATPase